MSSVRDLWLTRRKAIHIDKIKKSLTLEADTYDCGPTNSCWIASSTVSPLRANASLGLTLSSSTITIDFWAYLTPINTIPTWYIFQMLEASGYGITLKTTTSLLTLSIITTGGTYTATYNAIWYNWTRFTVTVDTANNITYLHINGEQAATATIVAGNFDTNTFDLIFGESVALSYVNGFIQDVALYNVYKHDYEVAAIGTHKGNVAGSGSYNVGLTYYWPLRGDFTATVGAVDLTGISNTNFTTDTYAPIGYGGSFIVALYEVTLTEKNSLMFPNARPPSTTGLLAVSWEDDDGVNQRRILWDLDGVIIHNEPDVYNGELLNTTFRLEWWNIDGADTLVVSEDIVVRTSKTTHPTTNYDTTAVAAASPTVDITLAADFPVTPFPLVFNTQQTY